MICLLSRRRCGCSSYGFGAYQLACVFENLLRSASRLHLSKHLVQVEASLKMVPGSLCFVQDYGKVCEKYIARSCRIHWKKEGSEDSAWKPRAGSLESYCATGVENGWDACWSLGRLKIRNCWDVLTVSQNGVCSGRKFVLKAARSFYSLPRDLPEARGAIPLVVTLSKLRKPSLIDWQIAKELVSQDLECTLLHRSVISWGLT